MEKVNRIKAFEQLKDCESASFQLEQFDGLYSLYDGIGRVFEPPVCLRSDKMAEVIFNHELEQRDKKAGFKIADDFVLYCVGAYNRYTGLVIPVKHVEVCSWAAEDEAACKD